MKFFLALFYQPWKGYVQCVMQTNPTSNLNLTLTQIWVWSVVLQRSGSRRQGDTLLSSLHMESLIVIRCHTGIHAAGTTTRASTPCWPPALFTSSTTIPLRSTSPLLPKHPTCGVWKAAAEKNDRQVANLSIRGVSGKLGLPFCFNDSSWPIKIFLQMAFRMPLMLKFFQQGGEDESFVRISTTQL